MIIGAFLVGRPGLFEAVGGFPDPDRPARFFASQQNRIIVLAEMDTFHRNLGGNLRRDHSQSEELKRGTVISWRPSASWASSSIGFPFSAQLDEIDSAFDHRFCDGAGFRSADIG